MAEMMLKVMQGKFGQRQQAIPWVSSVICECAQLMSERSELVRCRVEHKRNANTKATEYVTFDFSFSILVFFLLQESLNLTACQQNIFFSVLAAIIRGSSDKQLVLRIVKAFPFIHQPDRVAPNASDLSAADWVYQHMCKNTIFFHVCCYGFSQGRTFM